MSKRKPSDYLQTATIWFAWACWAIAYWQSSWWWVAGSMVPYLLSQSFGHFLDQDKDGG
ncbi:hypothetical protein AVME950_06020 [Acidovorax sp. SUPP950]|uniref:hypothetical protein n=1 Tax=unclassified Acidovorax TaxID=2684926 RepID=UPI0023BBFCC0|nr:MULTISPECIES: hypothetical protein [Comamonadaceae]WOI44910.1 hypothetical protein R1Z03_20675 [Paracidovorax avenae]GKS74422.1 hypothetical protein AVME950_06020 [Acidovorax sp. SUPP950]